VLLDEIGDLSALAQAKLLRFLQDKKVDRVGGEAPVPVDVRILAATSVDLEASIDAGRFRSDLYHRLAAFTITLPPLRDRREDVLALVKHFLSRDGSSARFSPGALTVLERYAFPGNIRELELVVRHAVLLCRGGLIEPDDLPEAIRQSPVEPLPVSTSTPNHDDANMLYARVVGEGEDFWATVRKPFLDRELSRKPIQDLVERALAEGGGSYAGAARLLRVDGEYRKFVDFLRHNQLRPGDR
jgi:transcriptional regulator with GAF, ATPase, and Fis domain